MEIPHGTYTDNEGMRFNVIGVSRHTETKKKAVILQLFNTHTFNGENFFLVAFERFLGTSKESPVLAEAFENPIIVGEPETLRKAPPGRYGHFKEMDMLYNGIGFAINTTELVPDKKPTLLDDADEVVMLYQPLYGEYKYQFCHRPLDMFLEHVEKPEYNYSGPRFRLIKEYPYPIVARP